MPESSNAHIVLNSRDATGGNGYNSLTFNATNQNIIQGNITRIGVNEINFPYDIPNIQDNTNLFYINLLDVAGGTVEHELEIVIPKGWYTGAELANDISGAIIAAATTEGIPSPALNTPGIQYLASSNVFVFTAPSAPTAPTYNGVWQFISPYTYPDGSPSTTNTLGKDIFSIMGFSPQQNPLRQISSAGEPLVSAFPFSGGSAILSYTQYIDVCSPQLCKFQYFRDGSTTNLARRSDVICRLYISNNIAIQENEGLRPFTINRQFLNSRMLKWTADNAVGTIDIQLYDDVGQPLRTQYQPRPYQITFNAYEGGDDSEKIDDNSESNLPRKFGPYKDRNAVAWSNLKRNQ
jgi:hypothetical protein